MPAAVDVYQEAHQSGQVATKSVRKLSLLALIGMVVGSMVGSGIFSLPRTFGIVTGPFGPIIARRRARSRPRRRALHDVSDHPRSRR
jgi:hypothetical protein